MSQILLYGAGGHCHIVRDALLAQNHEVNFIFDDFWDSDCEKIPKVEIIPYSKNFQSENLVHISIGDNWTRCRISNEIAHSLYTVIHLKSIVSENILEMGIGSFCGAGSVIQTQSRIGRGVIINTLAIVEHHVEIGNFVHIAPSAVLCGGVKIGSGTLIGSNAVIEPGVSVGKGCKIGSGSVIRENLPDGTVAVGSPAKIIRIEAGSAMRWKDI